MALVLASQSPRRRELMALVAENFTCCVADVQEQPVAGESPSEMALRLGREKAAAVVAQRPGDTVIGCDTVVELNGEALGKPRDKQHATRMLRALSGNTHLVHTGVAVYPAKGGKPACFIDTTRVTFEALAEDEIAAYLATDEPWDKAGAYGIQGWMAKYIPAIEGCFYNVMGLPVARLYKILRAQGAL